MPLAVEYIRRMRGGAQAQMLRCSDGQYYVVKFQNNPQGIKVLANELLATILAKRLGLPVPEPAVVEVREDLARGTEEMSIQLARANLPCQPGLCFGSRYPCDETAAGIVPLVVYDFLPDEQLQEVENRCDFSGMLVFDKWTCNTNGRQAIFYRASGRVRYQAVMIDHGFCFNSNAWDFPDAPLRGIYLRDRVYEDVRGMDSFEPWLGRLQRLDESALGEAAEGIPPEWYKFEYDSLNRMLEHLYRRKKLVPDLLAAARDSSRRPFPNWK